MDENAQSSLVISNDPSELGRVGAWVNAWSQLHDVPAPTAQRVDLCSAELVSNIMTYAYPDRAARRISLRLDLRDELLWLEIEDDGAEFDPRQVDRPQPAASLEEATIGGLGVHIARSLADGLRHRRAEGRNYLTLLFRLLPLRRTEQ